MPSLAPLCSLIAPNATTPSTVTFDAVCSGDHADINASHPMFILSERDTATDGMRQGAGFLARRKCFRHQNGTETDLAWAACGHLGLGRRPCRIPSDFLPLYMSTEERHCSIIDHVNP